MTTADYDYETEYELCPKCGHDETRWRQCANLFCDDGYEDEHDSDPINYGPGERMNVCRECSGTGIERWCPSCGADLSAAATE